MSDILKTAANSIPSFIWSDGEQPDATKYRNIFGAFSSTINLISSVLGPVFNTNVTVSTKDLTISSNAYVSKMSYAEQDAFLLAANSTILNTFNIARILGPHAALNPAYLPGSTHLKETQGIGYPLATGTKIQQLPFPPKKDYTYTISDGVYTWEKAGDGNLVVASPEGISRDIYGRYFYIDEGGTLYSNAAFGAGAYILYDLVIPNTASYIGAGYNCIPDLSILSISEEDRSLATGGKLGCLEVSFETSTSSYSRWLVKLPEVISLKEPLLSTTSKLIDVDSFDPVGMYSADEDIRFYVLNTDLYAGVSESGPTIIDNNLLALFNQGTGETYILDWEVATDITEDVPRSYYVNGPASLATIFRNDADALLSSGGTNTKDFILFVLGTNVAQQLAQISANYAKHKHNGADSNRISHKDLLDSEGNIQGLGDQEGQDNGLDFINYSRQLAYSRNKDNPHAQYFNRLGFLYGGSHGEYEAIGTVEQLVDLNAMHGDLLFYPIESIGSGSKPYKYADLSAYNAADTAGETKENIYWELNDSLNTSPSVATSGYFPNYRTHAMIFGWPNLASAERYNLGATKLYYEPWNFLVDTEYDNTGDAWTLARHGFVPGNYTGLTGDAKRRGLSINWGNLFFGYREDIFGGLLTGNDKTEASAYWRAGEFNVVTTANSQAGKNTNSKIKEGYNYRDGFTVRALKGSSIWLSTGAESPSVNDISTGKNSLGIPGTIALEASYPSSRGTTTSGTDSGILSLNTKNIYDTYGDAMSSGSGIFLAPGPFIDTAGADSYRNPWVAATMDDYKFASLWDSSSLGPVVTGNIFDGATYAGPGPMLDIFALAPDRQKTNATSNGNIPVGTDSDLLGWVFGRPFIRGTYGINFCVNGGFVNIDTEFKSGYNKKVISSPWGPTSAILKTSTNEYIHREFKFWGKNYNEGPSASADSHENTMGGNINLLYNFGRNYTRFGRSETWSNSTSLSGQTGSSQWTNSRRIALGSSKPEDYGSAIRQASFVDAFAGVRNDPYQPFIAEYVVPFVADYQIAQSGAAYYGQTTSVADLLSDGTFVIGDAIQNALSVSHAQPFLGWKASSQKYYLALFNSQDNSYTTRLDSLVRGSEEIYIEKSGERVPFTYGGIEYPEYDTHFPQSLIDFKVNLHYYIGQKNTGSIGTGDTDSPSEASDYNGLDYLNVIYRNTHKMVPAIKGNIIAGSSLSTDNNVIPVVFSSNNGQSRYPLNTIQVNKIVTEFGTTYETEPSSFIPPYSSGYDAALGVVPATNLMTTYRNKFPLFESSYGTFMSNKQFCILLNIQAKPVITAQNLPVPYQIYKGSGGEVYIRFSGWVTVKVKTADAF